MVVQFGMLISDLFAIADSLTRYGSAEVSEYTS
jgi:hypothetical protein